VESPIAGQPRSSKTGADASGVRAVNRSWSLWLLAFAQAVAGTRVAWRLVNTASGERVQICDESAPGQRVSAIVPVLNERQRLAPALDGLLAQPAELCEILVVDGGSTDGTQALVAAYVQRDARVRLLDAAPLRPTGNGKVQGLQHGLANADPGANWLLTIDADVRVHPDLTRSLLAHVRRSGAAAISLATLQHLSGATEGLVHPALLTTLVYRFGSPGQTSRQVGEVQANGQCSLYQRNALERIGGFSVALGSVCEDVTIARALAANGHAVGFHESDGLAATEMYSGWREAWSNWPRSLSLRDRFSGPAGWLGLIDVTLAQAAPLPLAVLLAQSRRAPRAVVAIAGAMLLVRVGVLLGMARAYPARPWTYWLSPVLDLPVTVQLWRAALRREFSWRGRRIVREDCGEHA
jgi:dolichol-phosphate mannosyltransferase